MSRRLSLGAGRMTPLRDGTSRTNSHAPPSSSFRSAETPEKDRRALLDEWRTSKRQRIHHGGPLLPPSASNGNSAAAAAAAGAGPAQFMAEGTTALERFRKRKLRMQQTNNNSFDEENQGGSIMSFDDQDDTISIPYYSSSSSRRGGGGGGNSRARRMTLIPTSSSRDLLLAPERRDNNSKNNNSSYTLDTSRTSLSQASSCGNGTVSMSQLTIESDPLPHRNNSEEVVEEEETISAVEAAGLRSQVREMTLRIEQLEKEKTSLSMAKAPLEARFRKMGEDSIKEQERLLEDIESLTANLREADERNRDLALQYEAAEEEATRLKLEVRKVSSTRNNNTNASSCSRQLQNDREVKDLKEKLRSATEGHNMMRLAKSSVEKELHATRIELSALSRGYEELQQEHDAAVKSNSDDRDAKIRLDVLREEHAAACAQLNAAASDLADTKARAEAAQTAMEAKHKKEVEVLQFEIDVLNARAGSNEKYNNNSNSSGQNDTAVLIARIEERDRRIEELEEEVLRGEEHRRQMHNRIQELRGNIRVFVRTRPFLPNDKQQDHPAIDVLPDGESLSIINSRSNSSQNFKFDKVFPRSSGQDHVFEEVADFVQSALDGYQVCLFSYGQTGSGKTHTMQGSGNGAMRGIIPRAVEQILKQAKTMQKQKWDFKLSASFLEIYNENLKDLLINMSQDKSVRKNPPKLDVKRTREGKGFVDGLTEVHIETVDSEKGMAQLEALMKVAARARSVASTKMNAQSSRSHSVFTLHIHGYNIDNGAVVHGSLNLCDLAGSERLDRSGAGNDKQRLKETTSINKSLSCLGVVFNALASGANHVPYRNSKLTYLLQDCLSGDGKALMFVNLSPTTASSNESLCSLRFAQRVNQVELGKPTKNIQYKS